ncbi:MULTISPECIES: acyltransferase family protein [unclassified Phyllobacterium]|uniref:acyltransferase family protein n=1 Tax=unclassified Phyllobacterium TaxID=2638441 RepID=UPI003012A43E
MKTYINIQGLRAVAVLMVTVSHIYWPILPLRTHWSQEFVDSIGPAGVDLFFVISGFVIYLMAKRSGKVAETKGRFFAFWEFVVKRLIRIYPVYWIAFGVATLIMGYVELAPDWLEKKPWLELFLLVSQPNNRILAAWTLILEMYFYAVAALVILILPRHIVLGFSIWFAVVTAAIALAFLLGKDWMLMTAFTSLLYDFLFGMAIGWLIERKIAGWGISSIAIGVLSLLVGAAFFRMHGGWFSMPSWYRMACFGIPSAFIVYGFVAVEVRSGWTFAKPWQRLGDASYSVYIWHQMIFACLAMACTKMGWMDSVPSKVLGAGFIIIAISVGFFSYYRIERPILKLARAILLKEPKSTIVWMDRAPNADTRSAVATTASN